MAALNSGNSRLDKAKTLLPYNPAVLPDLEEMKNTMGP